MSSGENALTALDNIDTRVVLKSKFTRRGFFNYWFINSMKA